MHEECGLTGHHVYRRLTHAYQEFVDVFGFRIIQGGKTTGVSYRVDRYLDTVFGIDQLTIAVLDRDRDLGHVGRTQERIHSIVVDRQLGAGGLQLQAPIRTA